MARVTSSPAAQQPKVTSHSAQASTTMVRGRNLHLLLAALGRPRQSPPPPVRERYGHASVGLELSHLPVTLGQRSNRFPED